MKSIHGKDLKDSRKSTVLKIGSQKMKSADRANSKKRGSEDGSSQSEGDEDEERNNEDRHEEDEKS